MGQQTDMFVVQQSGTHDCGAFADVTVCCLLMIPRQVVNVLSSLQSIHQLA